MKGKTQLDLDAVHGLRAQAPKFIAQKFVAMSRVESSERANHRIGCHAVAATAVALITLATGGQAQTLPTAPVSPTPTLGYEYNGQGQISKIIQAPGVPGLGLATTQSYDILRRLKDTTDAALGKTQYTYNGQDRLTSTTDPRNLVTQSPRSGLGDVTSLNSPDTGTATNTYDEAGNLKTRMDSRGVLSTFTYDALNRITQVIYSQTGFASEVKSWSYDQAGTGYTNGVGRRTSTAHDAGSTQYAYDPRGKVVTDTQVIKPTTGANPSPISRATGYGYDTAGRISSITYPSGRVLTIGYTAGQATTLTLAKDGTSTAVPLISGIQWEPYGAAKSWNWQMTLGSKAHARIYDANGRLVRYPLGDVIRDLTYDAADRITGYTHYNANTAATLTSLNQTFGYDSLGRLTTVSSGGSGWGVGYDADGNRTTVILNGSAQVYTTATTSNRLTAQTNPARTLSYHNAGNITADTGVAYTATYNLAGRLATLTKAGATATYSYDNDGRRIRKYISSGTGAGAASTMVFVYDQAGQLLGEYDSTGKALREYVWLGSIPVAIFTPDTVASNPPVVYYVHTDQLNTPRVVVDRNNKIRWRWLAEPFGTTAPETNPSSLGDFTQPLRMPGQYADQESRLFYNWYRYYDPSTGRYVQSDPIGLAGGINTYAYVRGNPISFIDPMGLATNCKTVLKLPGFDVQSCKDDGKQPTEQQAKNAKRMSEKQLDKACRANGYKDAHDLKQQFGLSSDSDIFADGDGNMYYGPRQGTGLPQYMWMNTIGP